MILEAFANYLQACDPALPAPQILLRWLWERLTLPSESSADQILKYEIMVELRIKAKVGLDEIIVPHYTFSPQTESGRRILKTLLHYSLSYEQQKWSRWVHYVKASDFNSLQGNL